MPTTSQCKSKLFHLGLKHSVNPALISTRLLSDTDKADMLNGLISDEALDCHVKVWRESGMPNYVSEFNGHYWPSSI